MDYRRMGEMEVCAVMAGKCLQNPYRKLEEKFEHAVVPGKRVKNKVGEPQNQAGNKRTWQSGRKIQAKEAAKLGWKQENQAGEPQNQAGSKKIRRESRKIRRETKKSASRGENAGEPRGKGRKRIYKS